MASSSNYRPLQTLIVFCLVVLGLLGLMALTGSWVPRLGLDLRGGTTITLTAVHGCQALPQLLALFDAADIPVRRVTAVPPTLDDVFLALTGTSLRESGDHS